MEKILVFTLLIINVQLVVANCSSEVATVCVEGYNTCVVAAGTNSDELCNCMGLYDSCLLNNDCITSEVFQNLVGYCESNGCSAQQCSGGVVITPSSGSEPVSSTPASSSPTSSSPVASPFNAPTSGCNSQNTAACADTYQSCALAAGTDVNAICNCYGPYFMCLFDFDCLTVSQYQNIVQSCTQSGCTLEQCAGNSTVIAPFSVPPTYEPTSSSPTSSGCTSQNAAVCADDYQSCVLANGTDVNASCSCFGPLYLCYFDIGCLTASEYQSVIQSCTQYGCTLEQCTGNSTVIAPFSVPPTYEPTSSIPVGAPISAPFAPPASVICLQPWELVLIVVGSLLAGIGLAAIVGVIIYLSRRSSAKKSTKYAKLQNY